MTPHSPEGATRRGADSIENIYPLSPLQRGMLFHSRLLPESGVYVVQFGCDIEGDLDPDALKDAWRQVIARHSVHRTLFARIDSSQPVQVVRRTVEPPWAEQDWRAKAPDQRERDFDTLLADDRRQGFDPSKAPLMRIVLLQLADDRWHMLWSRHHAISDGWSLPIVIGDLLTAYETIRAGATPRLAPGIPYENYIGWLRGRSPERTERYWRNALAGFGAPTIPCIDRVGSASETVDRWEKRRVSLDQETSRALTTFSREHGLTLNTIAQGAWALLLARYSGERDVLFGAISSGRAADLPGSHGMVGCFVNTLPVRVEVDASAKLVDWLRALKLEELEREEHGHASLLDIRRWSGLGGEGPLFNSLFVFENYPISAVANDPTATIRISNPRMAEQTSFPLTLSVVPGESMAIQANFAVQRYNGTDIERLLAHYTRLLTVIAESPDQTLTRLSPLSPEERHQLLHGFNQTAAPLPATRTLHGLVTARARQTPDALAVIAGSREVTYRALIEGADRIAQALRDRGVRAGDRVGLRSRRRVDMVEAALAILSVGAAYVPMDPAYPSDRIAYIIGDSRPSLVIGKAGEDHGAPTLDPEQVPPSLAGAPVESVATEVDPDATAYVIYTSGSTGNPKGIEISHANATAMVGWALDTFDDAEMAGTLAATSLCFDLSIFELFVPLSRGGTVILAENALALAQLPARDRVTLVNTVPSAMDALVRNGALPDSVRVVNLAGEPLSRELVDRIYALPGIEKVFNLYGPSEDTTYSTWALIPRDTPAKPLIGHPIANSQAYVVDASDDLQPIGVPGELLLGGAGVAKGYLNRPELTAERFVPDPFLGAPGRLYRTGDLVRRLPDGALEFLSRLDRQIKLNGYRIEPGEIEAALMDQPGVEEALVLTVHGDAGPRLAAYVSPRVDADGLRDALAARLPSFMVPARIIAMASLPQTLNGKIDHGALPPLDGPARTHHDTPPATPTEKTVATIWREVIGIDAVGAEDTFFDVGGNSILMIQIQSRINQLGRGEMTLADLFKFPTIRAIATHLDAAGSPPDTAAFDKVTDRLDRRRQALKRPRPQRPRSPGSDNGDGADGDRDHG